MKKPTRNLITDTGASATGAGIGLVVGGTIGAMIGAVFTPVLTDMSKRLLSPKERTRISAVESLAKERIQEKIDHGTPIRNDYEPGNNIETSLRELEEGLLLAARNSYEEKKVPLLANICATALFTNSPIENLTQVLINAERLSYRQLCILCLFSMTTVGKRPGLSSYNVQTVLHGRRDEIVEGVYADLQTLAQYGLLSSSRSVGVALDLYNVVPNDIVLTNPGIWLVNAMQTNDEPAMEDIKAVKKILSQKPDVTLPSVLGS